MKPHSVTLHWNTIKMQASVFDSRWYGQVDVLRSLSRTDSGNPFRKWDSQGAIASSGPPMFVHTGMTLWRARSGQAGQEQLG